MSPLAKAFNLGANARLMGLPVDACPKHEDFNWGHYWRMGWHDVDRNWGSKARWPILMLPEITRHAKT